MTNGDKEKWADGIERAKELFDKGWKELNRAAEDAKDLGEDAWLDAQKRSRQAWNHARAKGMELWEDARDVSADALRDARERGEEVMDDAERMVRKHPAKAIGLTLLIGVVIGALISRDRD